MVGLPGPLRLLRLASTADAALRPIRYSRDGWTDYQTWAAQRLQLLCPAGKSGPAGRYGWSDCQTCSVATAALLGRTSPPAPCGPWSGNRSLPGVGWRRAGSSLPPTNPSSVQLYHSLTTASPVLRVARLGGDGWMDQLLLLIRSAGRTTRRRPRGVCCYWVPLGGLGL